MGREFSEVWIDVCFCSVCAAWVWHVEWADEAVRDGFVPTCPDCGSRLLVVDHDGRGVRIQ
jgi:hypothetical protein